MSSTPYGDPEGDTNECPPHPSSTSPFDTNSGTGVNLRNLSSPGGGGGGGNNGGEDNTPSLLVASSIAPGPGDDGPPHGGGSVTSSLQAAAAAGGIEPKRSLPGTSLHAAAGQRQQQPRQQVYQEHHAGVGVPQLGQYQYHQPQMHQYPIPHHLTSHPPHVDEGPVGVGLPRHDVYGGFGREAEGTPPPAPDKQQPMDNFNGREQEELEGSEERGRDGNDDEQTEGGPVKLFVGQVPKSMNEEDLFPTFSEFGPIKELLVIRDKHTGQHRGCAFVTFWSASAATKAERTLHDQYTFPQGRKPIQIRPATEPSHGPAGSPEAENKLFIGMTSRNADENALRELFAPFGEIREIYIIRSADGSNKGCAFLKFATRESALAAIEALHDNFQMDGATRPLIVKFADTKAQRKARTASIQRNVSGGAVGQGGAPVGGAGGYYMPSGPPVPVYPGYQQQGPTGPPPMPMPPHTTQYSQSPYTSGYPSVTASNPPPPSYLYQHPSYPSYYPPLAHTNVSPVPNSNSTNEIFEHAPRTSLQSRQRPSSRSPKPPYGRQEAPGAVNPRPREGPAGANLFIYHLPHDLTDADLATAFNPFGNVISAKVYVDKYTGESKGFGFVSYDSVISAEQAIEQMNGFQIGSKRLKVQHKRVNKPTGPPSAPHSQNSGDGESSSRHSTPPNASAPILPSSLVGVANPSENNTSDANQMIGLPQSLSSQAGRYHGRLDVEDIGDELGNLEVNAPYQDED